MVRPSASTRRRPGRAGTGRPGAGVLAVLVLLAGALSGCAAVGTSGRPSPRVLGQGEGTPLVTGSPAPAGTGDLGAVSCPDARHCWAAGIVGTGGPVPPGGPAVIVATDDGGRSWRAEHVGGASTPQLSGIACPTTTRCMAVGSNGSSLPGGGVVVTTTDGGGSWASATAPSNVLTVAAVACARSSACTVIASSGSATWSARSADFGATWQQQGTLPTGFQPGNDLWCGASGTCLVPGYVPTTNGHGAGALAVSFDGGGSWALATLPAGVGILRSAVCPSASRCIAAGSTNTTVSDVVPATGVVLLSTDGGHTWASGPAPLPLDDVYSMSCADADVCAGVGTRWVGTPAAASGAVAQSGDGGQAFTLSSAQYVPTTLTGVSCPDTTSCVAVGGRTVARITLTAPRRGPTPTTPSTTGSSTTTSSTTASSTTGSSTTAG